VLIFVIFYSCMWGVGWASCIRMGVFVIKLDNWYSVFVSPIVDVMW
jgi:hypothetical protein